MLTRKTISRPNELIEDARFRPGMTGSAEATSCRRLRPRRECLIILCNRLLHNSAGSKCFAFKLPPTESARGLTSPAPAHDLGIGGRILGLDDFEASGLADRVVDGERCHPSCDTFRSEDALRRREGDGRIAGASQ